MRRASTLLACLLLISLYASAQRGVDFRKWIDNGNYSEREIAEHFNLMLRNNIEEVWLDKQLAKDVWIDGEKRNLWREQAEKLGIKIHTGNQSFGVYWLEQCRPTSISNQGLSNYELTECVEGLITKDLQPTPSLIQLKKNYQPIQFSFSGKRLTVVNTSTRLNIGDLTFSWVLTADGRHVESGNFETAEDRTGNSEVKLELKTVTHDKQTYLLEVRAFSKLQLDATAQAVEVAKEQFRLSSIKKKALKLSLDDKLETKETKNGITLKGNRFKYLIDSESGLISSLEFDGRELISGSIQPSFYFPNESEENSPWNHNELNWNLVDMKFQQSGPYLTTVMAELQLNGSSKVKLHYKVYGSGDCQITAEFDAEEKLPAVERFGVMLELASQPDSVIWFGRGPQPSFHGSNSAAFIGRNRMDQDELQGLAESELDPVYSEIDWLSTYTSDDAVYFGSKLPISVAIAGKESNIIGLYTDELSIKDPRPEQFVAGQHQRFGLRIRPFKPEGETALKLSRYHAGSMQVPQPKTAVGVTNDAVE